MTYNHNFSVSKSKFSTRLFRNNYINLRIIGKNFFYNIKLLYVLQGRKITKNHQKNHLLFNLRSDWQNNPENGRFLAVYPIE